MICHAQRQRESTNAIAETGAAQGLGDVARFAALEPVLTGEDLADEHWLPRAAAISQLVRRD